MAEQTFQHSEEWYEKLTMLRITNDYSQAEYWEIMTHLMLCPACQRVVYENAYVEQLLDSLPNPHFPVGMSPRIEAIWQEEDRRNGVATADSFIRELNF